MTMRLIPLDLETSSADKLWEFTSDDVRLAGYAIDDGPVAATTDIAAVVALISEPDVIVVGHNILSFDLPVLERCYGLDLGRLVHEGRVMDTMLVAWQNDPPLSGKADLRRYGLDAVARRVLGAGKVAGDGGSVLKALAARFGGFDKIPVDHPDYVRYLVQDVELVRRLAEHLVVDDYVLREHRVMHRLNQISRHGIRVDVGLAEQMVAGRAARVEALKQRLHNQYGVPLEGKAPHSTKMGKEALERAFVGLGVTPRYTEKGQLATGKDVLESLELECAGNPAAVELCRTLRALNGERSTAQTILDYLGPDGRLHPSIAVGADEKGRIQATGRISVTRPGLTVMGKRGRHTVLERALILPDEGDVLLPVDLAAIDGRAVALHCGDEGYAQLFAPGNDLHDEMAVAVFGDDGWYRDAGHHPRRSDAKAISHATNYGMGARGLAAYAGIDLPEAERQLAVLAAKFPQLAAWKDAVRQEASSQILTTAFGRRVRVHPGREYTQAPAFLGQGTARDLMMEGVLRLPEWLVPRLRAVVHDEVVLSVPADRVDEARQAVLAALQFEVQPAGGGAPIPVLAETGDAGLDWADCYRGELPWPEVARAHRELPGCDDTGCTWHGGGAVV